MELVHLRLNIFAALKRLQRRDIVHSSEVPADGQVVRDEVILLTARQEEGPEAQLRRVEVWLEDKGEHLVLVTNNLKLSASTIAAIYRERWRIELFFKALKQSLRVLGVKEPPVRSTLAYSNAHRPWHLYKAVFEDLYAQFPGEAAGRARKFRFRNPLLSL